MPVQRCQVNGKPGFKFGKSGKCFTYDPKNPKSKAAARARAEKQGIAIRISQAKSGKSVL